MTKDVPVEKKKFLFAGGGTGGHLYPAIAIAEMIHEKWPQAEIHFVGTKRGLENRVVPQSGYPLHFLMVRGFRRSFSPKNLLAPFALLGSLVQSVILLLKINPDVVIGTGGYVSGPVLFTAHLLGFRTVIQEQNSYPGVTTRLLARIVDRVHISYKESEKYFKNKAKLRLSGNPVRVNLLKKDKAEARSVFRLQPEKLTLLIFGGSQGAMAINNAVADAVDQIMHETDAQIIWSTGTLGLKMAQEKARQFPGRMWVGDYIDDMASAYAASDLVVSRAGAISLAEITNAGLPSILIPYPFAAANHQQTNAESLQAAGAATMILQRDLTAEKLAQTILTLLHDDEKRKKMAHSARQAAYPDATREIVASIFELLNVENKKEMAS